MVDRADPLSRPGRPRTAGPTAPLDPRGRPSRIVLAAIACLELAWFGWFLVAPLPNAPKLPNNVVFRRGFLLLETFPEVVPGMTFRRSMLGNTLSELSHLENLPQRIPIVLAAALIAAAAIGLGDAVLGLLRSRRRLRWPEWIALNYGLGAALLGGLTLIVGRMGWLDPRSIRIGLAALASLPLVRLGLQRRRARPEVPPEEPPVPRPADPLGWFFAALMAPFVVLTLLGAMLPATDFDVLEYHLQGPREYFEAGRIQFLPHNVYTNMPFDVEMLHLLGMSVMNDAWWGGLTGQLLVALFGPAAAVLIFATAGRASTRAGWLAALVYLSTPWVYRIGIIAYVEGPLCFYHIALVRAWLESVAGPRQSGSGDGPPSYEKHPPPAPESPAGAGSSRRPISPHGQAHSPARSWLLLGLLAGAAMGCKYTALISAVIPFGVLSLADVRRHRSLRPVPAYVLGWAVVMSPWLIKNVVDTGDPVYPLGYRVFHGRNWDPAMEVKWRAAHGPRPFSWEALVGSIVDVAGRSDWQSPLFLALAPLAFLRPGASRMTRPLAIYSAYLFATWFLLTHRLDRFWLPILPLLAVLAGLGADWARGLAWGSLLSAMLAIGLFSNLVFDASSLAGFNEWTGDLAALRHGLPERLNRPLARLDARLPADARVLLVGQAAVFHFEHPMVYNTVFNDETIEALARGRDVAALRQALRDRGLTHIYVDWKEVQRYREPGNYGYTDFVTKERFAAWVAAGLLDRPVAFGPEQELYRIR